jgi:hypothetical protein
MICGGIREGVVVVMDMGGLCTWFQ